MKNSILVLLLLFVYGCNDSKTSNSTLNKQTQNSTAVSLKEELPPANVCNSDLGVLRMDANGHSIGSKTEMTELRKLLNNSKCDVIEISYELKGSYGKNIEKKLVYDKREMRLQDVFAENNVIEDYKNVSVEGLNKFLLTGEKSFYSLTDYANAQYDFNNREMTNKAVGAQPLQSDWDGSVDIVIKYVKKLAKDSNSIEFLEWSKIIPLDTYWVVRCKYKGSNSFGAMIEENKWFYIQNENVVKTKDAL